MPIILLFISFAVSQCLIKQPINWVDISYGVKGVEIASNSQSDAVFIVQKKGKRFLISKLQQDKWRREKNQPVFAYGD